MKKVNSILLYILQIIFLSSALKAQSNLFIKDGAKWIYNVSSGDISQGLHFDEKYQYKIYSDTIVNNTNYKLLGTAIKTTIRTIANTTENYTCETYSLIRYDSINKLLYHQAFSDTCKTLLYDFNMQIGDSIHLKRLGSSFDYNPKNTITVDSIYKISIGGDSMKVFILADSTGNGQLESFIIEGFGSFTGLLWHNQKYITTGDVFFYSELVYYENDSLEFKFEPVYNLSNNKIQQVNIITTIPEEYIDCILEVSNIQNNEIEIFPNPTENILNIKTSQIENNLLFQLFDIYGNIKIESTINNKSNNTFDVTHFASGIYYYLISNDTNIHKQGKVLVK